MHECSDYYKDTDSNIHKSSLLEYLFNRTSLLHSKLLYGVNLGSAFSPNRAISSTGVRMFWTSTMSPSLEPSDLVARLRMYIPVEGSQPVGDPVWGTISNRWAYMRYAVACESFGQTGLMMSRICATVCPRPRRLIQF